jgi:hypothetical protein
VQLVIYAARFDVTEKFNFFTNNLESKQGQKHEALEPALESRTKGRKAAEWAKWAVV